MRVADFDYELPPELIAQRPMERRDSSRLMVVGRGQRETFADHRFRDLPGLLQPGDVLVLNDTRVLAARVQARRATGGAVEVLFVEPDDTPRQEAGPDAAVWRAMVRPAKRVAAGDVLETDGGPLRVIAELADGQRALAFPPGEEPVDWLDRHGQMPLPPYIHAEAGAPRLALDRDRYQTVYARRPGAVAAPTAGLHFTPELLDRLRQVGVEVATVTLDVGPGTFRPVTAENVEDHRMDGERYRIPEAAAATVNRALRERRRIVAVGTTAVRTLEHAAGRAPIPGSTTTPAPIPSGDGRADLFIAPGYEFRVVGAMITNLHLPRSTPILLASALVGRETLLAAYAGAVERGYRFYSYGDAMLLQ